jgi:chromosome segregation ATPase
MDWTFGGKILVIVIVAFALSFLGISAVVFTTSKDWTNETKDEQTKIGDLKKKLTEAAGLAETAKKELEDAKRDFEAQSKQLNDRLTALEEENKRDLATITETHGQIDKAQQSARGILDQVQVKRKAVDGLLAEKKAVQEQASAYTLHQDELTDRVREVERLLDAATNHKSSLKDRVGP